MSKSTSWRQAHETSLRAFWDKYYKPGLTALASQGVLGPKFDVESYADEDEYTEFVHTLYFTANKVSMYADLIEEDEGSDYEPDSASEGSVDYESDHSAEDLGEDDTDTEDEEEEEYEEVEEEEEGEEEAEVPTIPYTCI